MFNASEIWASSDHFYSLLPFLLVAVPLAGSLLVLAFRKVSSRIQNALVVLVSLITFIISVALYPLVVQGKPQFTLSLFMEFGFLFRVDYLSFLLAVIFAFIWFLVSVYNVVYMEGAHAKIRFNVFFLSTLGHVLGVVVAGDLFSFFLFFELMTFSSYVLVIHNQTPQAMRAGAIYIYMGVIGGLSLLMGILLIYHGVGTLEIAPMLEGLLESDANLTAIAFFFLVGFGIKIGMVPLHIWMPKVYEAAPSPVNALSSATMLKVGAYGLIRVMLMLFTPENPEAALVAESTTVGSIGFAVIWMGILTMLIGAIMALLQTNSKRILACSSISQMGYVLLGIGVAAYLGLNGAMGYAGALYHMINHAFLKAGLFLVIGTIFIHTRENDSKILGGLSTRFPFLMGVFFLGLLGIGGIPGFNGYISKTLLHHAIEKAYALNADPSLWVAEKIFVVASALTICYFVKLFLALFTGETPVAYRQDYKISPVIKGVLSVFSLTFVLIGIFPGVLYNNFILPSLSTFTYDPANIGRYLEGINFFAAGDVIAVAIVLVVAAFFYTIGRYWNSSWFSIESLLYEPLYRLSKLVVSGGSFFDEKLNTLYDKTGKSTIDACKYVGLLDRSVDYPVESQAQTAADSEDKGEGGEETDREAYTKKERKLIGTLMWNPEDFNTKNINFGSLIMAFMLGALLMVLFVFAFML